MTDADVDGSHIRTLLLTFLFRHMLALIEQGHVYVAQPPLFKITKRKKEQYIFDERDLDRHLEELGAGSLVLERVEHAGFEPITGPRLQNLAAALGKIQDIARALERRGVVPADYFARLTEAGKLPSAMVASVQNTDNKMFVFGDEEIAAFIAQEEALIGREARVFEEGDDTGTRREADVFVARIYEQTELENQVRTILDFGVDPRHWGESDDADYRLQVDGGEALDLGSLEDVLTHVRKAGQKGVDVQRYKGLGEMNHDELWATTMDPARRTLLRVQMADGAEADRLFSLLMGESVEPRRQFVEQHALEVRNLDV